MSTGLQAYRAVRRSLMDPRSEAITASLPAACSSDDEVTSGVIMDRVGDSRPSQRGDQRGTSKIIATAWQATTVGTFRLRG